MAGSDKDIPEDEQSRSTVRRGFFPRRAEPTPVTEAMVTPRTHPPGSEERPPTSIRFCHSCGTGVEPGSSYCLACGVRFGAVSGVGEGTPTRQKDEARGSSRYEPVAGVTEFPQDGWGEQDVAGESAAPGPSPRRALRIGLVGILVVAVLAVGLGTLRNRDEPAPAPTEELSTTATVAIDDSDFRGYVDQVAVVSDDVTDLRASGRQINDDWDNRIADYDTTINRMSALISRTGLLPIRFNGFTRPLDADRLTHERMAESLDSLLSAAEGMMAGLQSTDTGEVRLGQLARFEAAASEFGSLADQVERSADEFAAGSGG